MQNPISEAEKAHLAKNIGTSVSAGVLNPTSEAEKAHLSQQTGTSTTAGVSNPSLEAEKAPLDKNTGKHTHHRLPYLQAQDLSICVLDFVRAHQACSRACQRFDSARERLSRHNNGPLLNL